MEITECKKEDFPLLNKYLPAVKDRHIWRYGIQDTNRGVYLVAWEKEKPVGLLVLIYDGVGVEGSTNLIIGCADIKYLYVHDDSRRQGIAEALINEAIDHSLKRGYKMIGLLVDKKNIIAKNLYQKLGFKNSDHGDYPGTNIEIVDGKEVRTKVIAEYWHKDIA
jgi:ribosomal protein S18 acetylase RimI-like enzyme